MPLFELFKLARLERQPRQGRGEERGPYLCNYGHCAKEMLKNIANFGPGKCSRLMTVGTGGHESRPLDSECYTTNPPNEGSMEVKHFRE